MESLYRFFLRYHVFLIFLLLEGISFTFIYKSSNYQQSAMMAKIDAAKGVVYSWTSEWTSYFGLKQENEKLAKEVTDLRNQLSVYKSIQKVDTTTVVDTLGKPLYTFISGEVINNTTNRQNNTFIINIGENHGVEPEMGVISEEGVAGIIRRATGNYSTAMSILNPECKLSAKLKRSGHIGPLSWDGVNTREGVMLDVPQHAVVEIGDTVVTSGYTSTFPEGIMIGTVSSYEVKKGNSYEIRILLGVDFNRLRYVNVINSTQRREIKEHEK